MQLGKAQEKTVQRKLIRLIRIPTSLCHPEHEGAFSAGVCTSSLFLFDGPCERSTPFRLRLYEFPIVRTTEIPLITALKYSFLLTFCSHKTCYKSFAIPMAYTGYDGCPSHEKFPQAKLSSSFH